MPKPFISCILGAALWAGSAACAVAQAPGAVAPSTPILIEMTAEMRDGRVQCLPPIARLPARQLFLLTIVNRTDLPIRLDSAVLLSEPDRGAGPAPVQAGRTMLAGPRETVRVRFRSPAAGEYPYRCAAQGTPRETAPDGRFVVIAAGRQ